MNEKEKLELLKEKAEMYSKIAYYNESIDNMLQDFYNAKSLSDVYEAATGKEKFSIKKFVECRGDDVTEALVKQIDEVKNDKRKSEKEKVKKELFLKDSIFADASTTLNEYYDDLKERKNLDGNYKEYYIPKLLTPLNNREISNEETKDIINAFLQQEEPDYKDIYNDMDKEGRVFLLDSPIKSINHYGGGCNGANYDSELVNDSIVVKKYKNDLARLSTIAHETAHEIELTKLRENLNKDEFLNYRLSSQYGEMYPVAMQFKCLDFLEENDLYKDEVKNIRTRLLLEYKRCLNNMIVHVYNDETSYLENFNHDLEYANALVGGIYLSNKDDKTLIEDFDREKLECNGLEIFDKIGCESKEFDKTLAKHLTKCL